MSSPEERRLAVVLEPGQQIWVVGAVRVRVVAGVADINGAILAAGPGVYDLISPPFDSIPSIQCHSLGFISLDEEEVVAHAVRSAVRADTPCCVLELRGNPVFKDYLKDYSCAASGLSVERTSLLIPGACLLRSHHSAPATPAFWALCGEEADAAGAEGSDSESTASDESDAGFVDTVGVTETNDAADIDPADAASVASGDGLIGAVETDPGLQSVDAEAVLAVFESEEIVTPVPELPIASPLPLARKRNSRKCRVCSQAIAFPPSWLGAMQTVVDYQHRVDSQHAMGAAYPYPCASIFMVGSKGSGKSTFNRALVNRLITRSASCNSPIAYVDLDLGQPEHTVPGLLSLAIVTEPLLTSPLVRVPQSAHPASGEPVVHRCAQAPSGAYMEEQRFIGACSPKHDLGAVIAASKSLIDAYRCRFSHLPLVVNCHGWTKGAGYLTLQAVLTYLQPSHFFSFEQPIPAVPGRKYMPTSEVLTAPAQAHVTASHSHSLASTTFYLPSWHREDAAAGDAAETDGVDAEDTPKQQQGPPRAVRSPTDLRAARLLNYFLYNLQPVDILSRIVDVVPDAKYPKDLEKMVRLKSEQLREIFGEVFRRVLADQREARAPRTGLSSPASVFSLAKAWKIPVVDVNLLSSSSSKLGLSHDRVHDCRPATLVGQLVGLCTASSYVSSDVHSVAARLPCVGVGYVRHCDEDAEELHIVSPLSSPHMELVDTVVSWIGAHDIPAQLLYRGSPHGDPFCMPTWTIGNIGVANTTSGTARKNLPRKSHQPRKG